MDKKMAQLLYAIEQKIIKVPEPICATQCALKYRKYIHHNDKNQHKYKSISCLQKLKNQYIILYLHLKLNSQLLPTH